MEIKKHELEPNPRLVNKINLNDEIFLSVSIGNGQIGGNKVSLDTKILAKGNLTHPVSIGNINELSDKEIIIETNVLDVNAFTNMCVITTTFLNQENSVLFSKIDKGDAPENGIASFKGQYLLKVLPMIIFFFFFFGNILQSQNTVEKIDIQSLETPASPGFILLDKTPSSIEKPTTPQGFGISLLGLLQGTGGAIDFAPFWLFTHPNLTANTIYNSNFPILSTLTVSTATIVNKDSNYLSGGIRTRIFQYYNPKQKEQLKTIESELTDLLSESSGDLDKEKIEKTRVKYINIKGKPIISIDFAAAVGGGATTNTFTDLQLNRWAAWLSFNYRPKGNDFYFTVLGRYINNEKYEDYNDNSKLTDIGTRLNYDISRFCISLEYLQRFNFTSNTYSDYRIAFIGSYQLSENFYLISSFGKNFTDVNNIIALVGINFGFSNKKIPGINS